MALTNIKLMMQVLAYVLEDTNRDRPEEERDERQELADLLRERGELEGVEDGD